MKKKRKGRGKSKGSAFERSICRQLSLWWSKGRHDDIFWRTSNSGGRATVRNSTTGEGDIGAVRPSGHLLIKAFTFELKCGYNSATPFDLVDMPKKSKQRLWEQWITKLSVKRKDWIIIAKRDRRKAVVAMDMLTAEIFRQLGVKFVLEVSCAGQWISICTLQSFLKADPQKVKRVFRYEEANHRQFPET